MKLLAVQASLVLALILIVLSGPCWAQSPRSSCPSCAPRPYAGDSQVARNGTRYANASGNRYASGRNSNGIGSRDGGSGGGVNAYGTPAGRRYYNGRYFGNFNNRYYGPQYGYF